jgi:hypothetical protein
MALKINEELEGLNAAKKELMYNKHRLSYQTYHSDTYSSSHWDTWAEWKMDGIRKILDRHDKMIRSEIDEEISKLNKEIESL